MDFMSHITERSNLLPIVSTRDDSLTSPEERKRVETDGHIDIVWDPYPMDIMETVETGNDTCKIFDSSSHSAPDNRHSSSDDLNSSSDDLPTLSTSPFSTPTISIKKTSSAPIPLVQKTALPSISGKSSSSILDHNECTILSVSHLSSCSPPFNAYSSSPSGSKHFARSSASSTMLSSSSKEQNTRSRSTIPSEGCIIDDDTVSQFGSTSSWPIPDDIAPITDISIYDLEEHDISSSDLDLQMQAVDDNNIISCPTEEEQQEKVNKAIQSNDRLEEYIIKIKLIFKEMLPIKSERNMLAYVTTDFLRQDKDEKSKYEFSLSSGDIAPGVFQSDPRTSNALQAHTLFVSPIVSPMAVSLSRTFIHFFLFNALTHILHITCIGGVGSLKYCEG